MAIIQIDIQTKDKYWQADVLLLEYDLDELAKRVAVMLSHVAFDVKNGAGVPPPNVFDVNIRRYR